MSEQMCVYSFPIIFKLFVLLNMYWSVPVTYYLLVYRRAHRLTVFIIFSMVLVHVALWEDVAYDSDYNTKR